MNNGDLKVKSILIRKLNSRKVYREERSKDSVDWIIIQKNSNAN